MGIRNGQRFCKCGHSQGSHNYITLKEIPCIPGRCFDVYRGGTVHRCRMEHKVGRNCLVEGCDCRSVRPESNLERQGRLGL